MANGAAIADLVVGEQKGRWAILTVVLLGLSAGMSTWIVEEKIEDAITTQAILRDQQITYLELRITKIEADMAEQHGRLWAEMARRPDTDAVGGRRREVDRRLDTVERRVDNLGNVLFRNMTP